MNMKFKNYHLAVVFSSSLLAATACQSSHPAATLPPKQAIAPALTANVTPTPDPADKSRQPQAAEPVPVADPVTELIAGVEKEFQSGQTSLKAGNADEARQHFDQALDMIAASSLDVETDARLQSELRRVVAGVQSLEQERVAD